MLILVGRNPFLGHFVSLPDETSELGPSCGGTSRHGTCSVATFKHPRLLLTTPNLILRTLVNCQQSRVLSSVRPIWSLVLTGFLNESEWGITRRVTVIRESLLLQRQSQRRRPSPLSSRLCMSEPGCG